MRKVVHAVATAIAIFIAQPAFAQTIITQAKALAGNVTPGDTAGYPITLSQPGAYVLGSNLTVPNNQYGIFAGADNIDIDLNGFTLTGNGVGTYGIVSNKAHGNIHGGVISMFKGSGIYLRGDAWTIESTKIAKNGASGIDALGVKGVSVKRSYIANNSIYGIILGNYGVIEGNDINNNSIYGISCRHGCRISHNTIYDNFQMGIFVLSGTANNNVISNSAGYGIYDVEPIDDLAVFENTLLGNNANSTEPSQIREGVRVYGNTCIGKPC